MNREEIAARIVDSGIVAVLRVDSAEQLVPITDALCAGGVTSIEVTMTTPNALEAIATLSAEFNGRALVGVGTVLDAETCRAAIKAGAQFVVTPIFRPEVIDVAHELGKPIAAGSYSPTEAYSAHQAGADFIKVFPADQLGPTYIKNLLAPLPMLRIIPTGGVSAETAASFLNAGCVALAAGSSLVSKDVVKNKNWAQLTATAKAFTEAVKSVRAGR